MALVTVSEGGGGNFMPIVKYDSRAGRIFRVDKDEAGSTPVDITRTFKGVFDFENVEVGYILFAAGGAPDFRMAPYGSPLPAKPTADHKQGVRLHVKLSKECGGDVRELSGTANAFLRGVNAVHDEYTRLAPANPGKLPVIVLTDTIAVESGGGAKRSTNYQPIFSIAGWAARPADMVSATNGATGAPAKATTNHAATNDAMIQKPAPAAMAADDFG